MVGVGTVVKSLGCLVGTWDLELCVKGSAWEEAVTRGFPALLDVIEYS